MKKNNSQSGLDKIGAILKQMGISEEAIGEFVNICESWHNEAKEKLQQEYKVRLDKAKKLCIEEVEAHKSNLSRGVKMFLDSQGDLIRRSSEKSSAIAESEAVNKLKKITNLLNGLDVDSAANAQALQAESRKNAELVSKVANLTESLNREKAKAAKFGELSEKSLARQRKLEEQATKHANLLSEARNALAKSVPPKRTAETISENKTRSRKPVSTTKNLNENNIVKTNDKVESDDDIEFIAESMDS